MSISRLRNKSALRDADSPDRDEAPMIASGAQHHQFADRRLRNRLMLLNLLAWIVILSLLVWIWG